MRFGQKIKNGQNREVENRRKRAEGFCLMKGGEDEYKMDKETIM